MNSAAFLDECAREVADGFATQLGGTAPEYALKSRPDGDFIVFRLAHPADHHFAALERANEALSVDHVFRDRSLISERTKKPLNVLATPEAGFLQRELSQSLTVDRNTFGSDFLARYTRSVTNHETSIVGNANFVVYGRRGAGKSSLLAYAMHHLKKRKLPYVWIAIQTYSGRGDAQAIASVVGEIVREAGKLAASRDDFAQAHSLLQALSESEESRSSVLSKIERLIPRLRTLIGAAGSIERPLTIFLDDLHVVDPALQPVLLGAIYSMTRDNNTYIKASGIEQFTRLWDDESKRGLQTPHDTQVLKLDYNLTMPDRSKKHIYGILDAHARYCGLPNIRYLAGDDVISRLVLVAAAVPRDALSLFSQAMRKSATKGEKSVSITSINSAASETLEEKIKDIGRDLFSGTSDVDSLVDRVKKFCIEEQKTNAFLVKIENMAAGYASIQQLIALRLVHVLHEGITPKTAGKRYVAMMLDFGFYVGIRAAKSVVLFPDKPRLLLAKELRRLPVLAFDAKPIRPARPKARRPKVTQRERKAAKPAKLLPKTPRKRKPAAQGPKKRSRKTPNSASKTASRKVSKRPTKKKKRTTKVRKKT